MLDLSGWIGSWLLAVCGAPEAWYAFRDKDSTMKWPFLLLWYFGEILVLLPIAIESQAYYLLFNYSLNTFFISVIIFYKLKRKYVQKT